MHTEDGLVEAYEERRELVREAISRETPPMLALMDLGPYATRPSATATAR